MVRQVWRLNAWLASEEDQEAERELLQAPPHGMAFVTLDERSLVPAASLNRNRIALCGAEGGLTEPGLRNLVDRFRARRIPRLFVWLSPGEGIEQVRTWLNGLSFKRVVWTRYPTLLHQGDVPPTRDHPFEIRTVGVAAFIAAQAALGDAVFEGYERTLEHPGFHHFIAYDGARPVAAAALVQYEDIGYLSWAGTVDNDRRRGAHTALIAHRVALAKSLGCSCIVSQTLTMLKDSLANLQRCGFREVYEQEVYELGA